MNPAPQVTGIVLAAGEAKRFGGNKLSLPFGKKTVLENVVDAALASSLDKVAAVLGHEADRLEALLQGRPVRILRNPEYETGQSSSIRTGLRAVQAEADAVLFLLGDQPLLEPQTIDEILAAYRSAPAPIVLPVFEGKRGNPVLFDRETFAGLDALSGDTGARVLFAEYTDRILRVPVSDPAVALDIDTEEDYRRLLVR